MSTMKRQCLAAMSLLGIFAPLKANSTNPYYLTMDYADGRPFQSQGYSGRTASTSGGGLSLEYRAWDALSLGSSLSYVAIGQGNDSAGLGYLDLFARVIPFGRGNFEPYALIGLGSDILRYASHERLAREASYHAELQLGLMYSINEEAALDLGLGYQMTGPQDIILNYIDLRLGLQVRFGAASPAVQNGKTTHAKTNAVASAKKVR